MYKIYFDDRVVLLTDNREEVENSESGVGLFYPFFSKDDLKRLMYIFQENRAIKKICVFSKDLTQLNAKFHSLFSVVEAAGGLVRNFKGDILVIKRKGRWDLPKGLINPGEDVKDAAIRKVTEETGIKDLRIVGTLSSTYHAYDDDETQTLKRTYWYEMRHDGNEELIPAHEEGISDAIWIKPNQLITILKNTYLSLFDIFEAALNPDAKLIP